MIDPHVPKQRSCGRPVSDRSRRDGGVSLVETLVAIVLLGLVGVAVLSAFAGTIRASTTNRALALEQSWLASAEDLLASAAVPIAGCEVVAAAAYQAVLDGESTRTGDWPTGALKVVTVERWLPSERRFDATRCDPSTQLHRLTLSAEAPGVGAPKSLQTLKVGGR
jgi:Tfp pilus assembly protein PilX